MATPPRNPSRPAGDPRGLLAKTRRRGYLCVAWRELVGMLFLLLVVASCTDRAPNIGTRPDTAGCPTGSGQQITGFPESELPCLAGPGRVRMSVVHGRPEVINLWASWCGPCREETALLQRAHERLGGNVLFLGVDVKDSRSHAQSFLDAAGVTYPQVFDADGSFARLLRLQGVPNTLVVDATGHVVYRRIGELSEADLREGLARLGFG
jgi:cytochrome c biogenesis protein CcmG/thiol:disulfide interchange protein DsbE